MKRIQDVNFADRKVVMRVDFNVPLHKESREVTDDTRIRAALPSIQKILNDGGSVVLMSHLGRPKEGPEDKYSLRHALPCFSRLLGQEVAFATDCAGDEAFAQSAALKPGEVLLLENVRFYKQEEKGDVDFASKLARHGNFYVNDAFGTAHREHASTATMARFFGEHKAAGYLMAAELSNADKVIKQAERPFTAIMGGAKVSDKILIIENLLDKVDHLLIGGGMVFTFFKAMGGSIGNSLCEDDKLELALQLIEKAKVKGVNLVLPVDSVVADAFSNDANTKIADNNAIEAGWMGLDLGPRAIEQFTEVISKSKTLLWNGPAGVFEMSKFEAGTKAVAEAIVKATQQGAFSLIGGGDSAAAINQFGLANEVSYVSTGGGALLEYMEGKVLPGVAALAI
jgi:phosphoglycerate kinase